MEGEVDVETWSQKRKQLCVTIPNWGLKTILILRRCNKRDLVPENIRAIGHLSMNPMNSQWSVELSTNNAHIDLSMGNSQWTRVFIISQWKLSIGQPLSSQWTSLNRINSQWTISIGYMSTETEGWQRNPMQVCFYCKISLDNPPPSSLLFFRLKKTIFSFRMNLWCLVGHSYNMCKTCLRYPSLLWS